MPKKSAQTDSRVGIDSAQGGRNAVEHIIAGGSLTHPFRVNGDHVRSSIVLNFEAGSFRREWRVLLLCDTKGQAKLQRHSVYKPQRDFQKTAETKRRTEVPVLTGRLTLCRPSQLSRGSRVHCRRDHGMAGLLGTGQTPEKGDWWSTGLRVGRSKTTRLIRDGERERVCVRVLGGGGEGVYTYRYCDTVTTRIRAQELCEVDWGGRPVEI